MIVNAKDFLAIEIAPVVIPETVGQYTGLKDRNGVDVYEGDTVKSWYPCGTFIADDLIVEQAPMGISISNGYNHANKNNIEVIGNIHERI